MSNYDKMTLFSTKNGPTYQVADAEARESIIDLNSKTYVLSHPPTVDGTYAFHAIVENGVATYQWIPV